ncbi:MFS transporter [Nonomuraea africana]|uniref:EmrB/QacA subfamily drug resistance transporter n=1 Tax=Nonomuraea africana TaxID=46171 RepID=A0ABR9KAL0_9ACTN|nr:MFS transporter [Nonomuraea africana]MBE1559041.1 EmrB/QacA subfamily drug resistance transporter [Nonomuraea africana]
MLILKGESRFMDTRDFVWTPRHVGALAVLCLAQVLDSVDVTVVNVALPAIQDDLGFSAADLSWVMNAYMVVFGGFLLLGGRLGDSYGHRRVLLGGITLFTVASLAAGLAQNASSLVAARAAQGLGAALIAPMTLALIALIFPEGRPRNRAFAIWGAATGASSTLGLFAGGLLADGPGWRWIFFINVPIGVLLLIAARQPYAAERITRARRGFDLVGAAVSTAGVSLLAYAVLQTAAHPWASPHTIGLLAAAAALLVYFVVHEARIAKEPLVPLRLFGNRSVAGANLIQALRGGAMFAVFYFATLFLQEVLGYSALQTGLAYVPLTLLLVGAAGLGPMLVRRFGTRLVITFGSLITAGGLLLFTGISPDGALWPQVMLPLLVTGFGFGLVVVPLTAAALAGVPPSSSGVASSLLNVSAQLGGALGLAVLSTTATGRTADALKAGAAPAEALTDGFRLGFAVAAALMAVVVAIALAALTNRKESPA